MNIISNSSPLIFLSKIGRFEILPKLFDKVYIPNAVYQEAVLSDKNDDTAAPIAKGILDGYIIQFHVQNKLAVKALAGRLHPGEIEVIVGASELGINNVILDDLYARNKAKQFNLHITGTIGVLQIAYRIGIIKDFESEIHKLISTDFRISPTLLQRILADLKET